MSTAIRDLHYGLYTADQTRDLDRLAAASGIAGFELMQRAGAALFRTLRERWPETRELMVFTGSGNNGGDGLVLAALARQQGLRVRVWYVKPLDELKGEAARARELAAEAGVSCEEADHDAIRRHLRDLQGERDEQGGASGCVLVDALLGTGISGEVREPFRRVIELINGAGLPVLSVDLPSGLEADTGRRAGVAVRASVTVSFIGLNRGLLTAEGPDHCGELLFDRLGVPDAVYREADVCPPSARCLDIQCVLPLLSARPRGAHKGDCGHVVVVGGDHGMGGAALMSAEAAARSGAGTVSLLTRPEHVTASLSRQPEIMVRALSREDGGDAGQLLDAVLGEKSVLVAGPGLGRSAWSVAVLRAVLDQHVRHSLPLVLDADALNLLSRARELELPSPLAGLSMITPHPGEAARLLGSDAAEVQADRFKAVVRLQQLWDGVALLKGVGTLICQSGPDQAPRVDVCVEGNPGMASGGMGDVLSGIIGGLRAQGLPAGDAVRCAAAVHGESADLAAQRTGERGLLATDLMVGVQQLVSRNRRRAS